LNPEILQKLRNNFYDDPKNVLAQNVCTRIDPFDVCLSRKHIAETQHAFTHKVRNGFVILQIGLLLVGFDCHFTFHYSDYFFVISVLQIDTEGKPITNQKNSGRCWVFAALNVIRVPFMQQHNLDEFEFSQAYLFFWDKVRHFEYCNLTQKKVCLKCGETSRFSFFRLNAATISLPIW